MVLNKIGDPSILPKCETIPSTNPNSSSVKQNSLVSSSSSCAHMREDREKTHM